MKFVYLLLVFIMLACGKKGDDNNDTEAAVESSEEEYVDEGSQDAETETPSSDGESTPIESPRFLYVASGACYAGGVTALAGSSTITRYRLSDGQFDSIVLDYNTTSVGDAPAGLALRSDGQLLVAIENTGGRRVDRVNPTDGSFATFLTNAALTTVLRSLRLSSDGGLLMARTTMAEKFAYNKARVTQGANSFVQAPAGTCATANTMMVDLIELPSGRVAFAHAAASPNNRIGVINANGYAVVGDCLSSTAGPTTTALPTALAAHSSGDLLVTYGSTTLASNFVYSYRVDPATGVISSPVAAYNNPISVYGPSAMVIDGNTVYIANGAGTYNTIEKFTYSSATQLLTRVGAGSFVAPSILTRCIAGLAVGP